MKGFYVIIERNGEFRPYNIMPYLIDTWHEFLKKVESFQEESEDIVSYWNIPGNFAEYRRWIDGELQYQFWGRCEYEIVLFPWPPKMNKDGYIEDLEQAEKIDVYWQCRMNLDTITDLFIENINNPK